MKKGCKKGTYKITIAASATEKYKAATKVISIKVLREKKNDLTEKQNKHATEIAMNDYSNYDYVINNNDTLENLEKEVIKCIK